MTTNINGWVQLMLFHAVFPGCVYLSCLFLPIDCLFPFWTLLFYSALVLWILLLLYPPKLSKFQDRNDPNPDSFHDFSRIHLIFLTIHQSPPVSSNSLSTRRQRSPKALMALLCSTASLAAAGSDARDASRCRARGQGLQRQQPAILEAVEKPWENGI